MAVALIPSQHEQASLSVVDVLSLGALAEPDVLLAKLAEDRDRMAEIDRYLASCEIEIELREQSALATLQQRKGGAHSHSVSVSVSGTRSRLPSFSAV